MADVQLVLTDAGLTAFANAVASGTSLQIDRIKLGTGHYTPTGQETDIMTPFAPVREFTDIRGSSMEETTQFSIQDTSNDAYTVSEMGVFSGTTLLGISSHVTDDLFTKPANQTILWIVRIAFGDVESPTITFPDSDFGVVLATESSPGIVQRASATEVTAGSNNNKFVTPLFLAMKAATNHTHPHASSAETDTGTDGTKTVTPVSLNGSLYRRIRSGTADPNNSVGVDGDFYVKRRS